MNISYYKGERVLLHLFTLCLYWSTSGWESYLVVSLSLSVVLISLTHLGRDKMVDIFKSIFLNDNTWISIDISLKLVSKGLVSNISSPAQIMACSQPATSHYLNQWWWVEFYWRIYALLGLNELYVVLMSLILTRSDIIMIISSHPCQFLLEGRSLLIRQFGPFAILEIKNTYHIYDINFLKINFINTSNLFLEIINLPDP